MSGTTGKTRKTGKTQKTAKSQGTGKPARPADAGKWGDLAPRVLSGIVMAALGGAAIWAGGAAFSTLVAAVTGLMIWELVRMVRPGHDTAAWQEGVLATLGLAAAAVFPKASLLILLGVVIIVTGRTGRELLRVALYSGGILLAALGLVWLRQDLGLGATLWLVGIVVVTDILGYFAGRILGGPKFWPRISPKKTWAGTVAGWIGAAALSLILAYSLYDWPLFAAPLVVLGAVATSLASQMGDIAESALKRRMKVKDSSNIIPGHGGVLDRFDGLMGASLVVGLAVTLLAMGL